MRTQLGLLVGIWTFVSCHVLAHILDEGAHDLIRDSGQGGSQRPFFEGAPGKNPPPAARHCALRPQPRVVERRAFAQHFDTAQDAE